MVTLFSSKTTDPAVLLMKFRRESLDRNTAPPLSAEFLKASFAPEGDSRGHEIKCSPESSPVVNKCYISLYGALAVQDDNHTGLSGVVPKIDAATNEYLKFNNNDLSSNHSTVAALC